MSLTKGAPATIISALASLAGGATTSASTTVDTSASVLNGLEITCTQGASSTNPIATIQVFSSADDSTYDTAPCSTYDVVLAASTTSIQSFSVNCPLRYYRVKVKNNDASIALTTITIIVQNQLVA